MKNKKLTTGLCALTMTALGVSCTPTDDLGTSIYSSDKSYTTSKYTNDTYSPQTTDTMNKSTKMSDYGYKYKDGYVNNTVPPNNNYTMDNNPYSYNTRTLNTNYKGVSRYDNNITEATDDEGMFTDYKNYWFESDLIKYQDESDDYTSRNMNRRINRNPNISPNIYDNNNSNIMDYQDFKANKNYTTSMNSYNYANDLIDTSLIDDYKDFTVNDITKDYKSKKPMEQRKANSTMNENQNKEKLNNMSEEVETETE